MAKVASVNVDCATNGGAAAVWNLVNLLISNGWTKTADSDGTTYSSSGTQVTGPGSGANGLNNSNAWVLIQDPSGSSGRKFIFQRGSAQHLWLVRYARSAVITGGNATTTPSVASISGDLNTLIGSVSGTPPAITVTFGTLFSTTTNFYAHAVYESVPVFGVYQFWFAATVKLTGVPSGGGYIMGVDTTVVSGGLDQDPGVLRFASARSFCDYTGGSAWFYYGLTSPSPTFSNSVNRVWPFQAATDPNSYTGNDDFFPMCWANNFTSPYKGQGSWVRAAATQRNYPSVVNITTDAYVYMSNNSASQNYILMPWPENTAPLL